QCMTESCPGRRARGGPHPAHGPGNWSAARAGTSGDASGSEGVMMDPLIDPGEYAALAHCTYLNQASLGLIPRTSLEASVQFLTEVAQHGNLRLSDQAEARVLDGLRTAAAELLGAPVASVAVVGGASEGLGQLAALLSSAGGGVGLVASHFPSPTHPCLPP